LDEDLKKEVLVSINQLAVKHKFNSLEKPKEICLLADPFTPENGVLTATMKLKRNVGAVIYKKQIDEMYNILNKKEM
jgi:long-chain acyl-CoA synthetase